MNASPFAEWQVYYTILGTSSSALIGLMFVVITLIGHRSATEDMRGDGVSTFSSPTVVHFAMALLVSAALCAPWHSYAGPAAALAFVGVVGIIATIRAALRARVMESYHPDAEDWIWHWILPLLAYIAILASACFIVGGSAACAFIAAGSVAFLVLVGIRNSWDVVTYVAVLGEGD